MSETAELNLTTKGRLSFIAGQLEGAASIVSYGIETPEQHERLRDLLLDTARDLRELRDRA